MKIVSQQISTNNVRVASIMFTDIVGYTSLMERDQEAAMELLDKNRKMQKNSISCFGGTWIKEMGDGVLASFDSADDAAQCALDIQNEAKLVPGLQLRIGIHFGEVIFIQNDVFGCVVNLASRLQCLAKPGQILVSGMVANSINLFHGSNTNYLGPRKLKHIRKPVQVYRVGDSREPLPWWSTLLELPIQKVLSVALMLTSIFRL